MILDFVLQLVLITAIVALLLPFHNWLIEKSGFHILCGWLLGFGLYHWLKNITGEEINYLALVPGVVLGLVIHDQVKILHMKLTWRDDE